MTMRTRIVLANAPRARAHLWVSVALGYGFAALPIEAQRRMIEEALTEALTLAHDRLDPNPESVSPCPESAPSAAPSTGARPNATDANARAVA